MDYPAFGVIQPRTLLFGTSFAFLCLKRGYGVFLGAGQMETER